MNIPNPFTDNELEHLLSFLGFGNLAGRVWFLGMEEAGGGEENLRRRLTFAPVEDLYAAHHKLGILKHHEMPREIQPTWRGMCAVMLSLLGKPLSKRQIRGYQARELGRTGKDTFLLELMPLPKAKIGVWGYEELLPQYKSRADYYAQVLPQRMVALRNLLGQYTPAIVVGYGKSYWKRYKELFPGMQFYTQGAFQIAAGKPTVLLSTHFARVIKRATFIEMADLIRPVYDDMVAG